MQGPVFFPITMVGEGEWSREPGPQVSLWCDSGCQCTGVATVSEVEARVAGTFETGGIELQDPHITAAQCLMAMDTTVAGRPEPFARPPLMLPGSLELGVQLLQQGIQNPRHSLCCPWLCLLCESSPPTYRCTVMEFYVILVCWAEGAFMMPWYWHHPALWLLSIFTRL